jgi:AcrR family transcriptional regulator
MFDKVVRLRSNRGSLQETGAIAMDKSIEDRRDMVIEVAYKEFSAKGFAHTQVTVIAELSYVSTATIYKLFASKEALFLAAYNHGLDILETHVRAGKASNDPIESLRTVARSYAAVCDSPLARRIVRLQIAQNSEADDPAHADGFRLRSLVDDWFQPILKRCADAGFLQGDKLVEAYALIIGFIAHQTLTYGLIINENKTAKLSGDKVADEAVRVALLAYG